MSGKIEGKVVEITPSGSLVTDISAAQLQETPRDESVIVACDEHETSGIFPAEHGQPEATFRVIDGLLSAPGPTLKP